MIKSILKKIMNWLLKHSISNHENTFNKTRYCFYRDKKSNTLLIVFSGFNGGNTAKYNYIRTLWRVKGNKLFILDDVWNAVNVGSYYLGKNGDWYFIKDIRELVEKIAKQYEIDKIYTIGSSKGGTAALYYGIMLEVDACVIGAPQYYVGNYLSVERHLPILESIMGDSSSKSIDLLNGYVKTEIEKEHQNRPTVFLHYSPMEHTFDEHIRDMIDDLRMNGFIVHEDNNYSYKDHGEVAQFFPKFLVKTIRNSFKE